MSGGSGTVPAETISPYGVSATSRDFGGSRVERRAPPASGTRVATPWATSQTALPSALGTATSAAPSTTGLRPPPSAYATVRSVGSSRPSTTYRPSWSQARSAVKPRGSGSRVAFLVSVSNRTSRPSTTTSRSPTLRG